MCSGILRQQREERKNEVNLRRDNKRRLERMKYTEDFALNRILLGFNSSCHNLLGTTRLCCCIFIVKPS
jgi:hypothetical protein